MLAASLKGDIDIQVLRSSFIYFCGAAGFGFLQICQKSAPAAKVAWASYLLSLQAVNTVVAVAVRQLFVTSGSVSHQRTRYP